MRGEEINVKGSGGELKRVKKSREERTTTRRTGRENWIGRDEERRKDE